MKKSLYLIIMRINNNKKANKIIIKNQNYIKSKLIQGIKKQKYENICIKSLKKIY